MNNPYRAKPTRSRPDHSTGYGVHSQNMWNPMSRAQPSIPTKDIQQPSGISQTKETEDPWPNDSWNWNVDQQMENQHQHLQQQQHYVPTYTNPGQLVSNANEDYYYQNLNGNKKVEILNQHAPSDRNVSRMGTNRQTNHSDTFPPFTNYNQNQQYAQQPNSVKPNTVHTYEHSQWTNEQQSYAQQQRNVPLTTKEQLSHPPLPANNYNWNKVEPQQQNVPVQNSWRNYAEAPNQWHDQNLEKESHSFDEMGNECPPQLPEAAQPLQMFVPSNESANKEHSMNWSEKQTVNEVSNWSSNQNNPLGNQQQIQQALQQPVQQMLQQPVQQSLQQPVQQTLQQPVQQALQQPQQTYDTDNVTKSYLPQASHMNVSQEWQHVNVQNDSHAKQWLQQSKVEGSADVNLSQDNACTRSIDWQQNNSVSTHYPMYNVATSAESIANPPNSLEQENKRRSSSSINANLMQSNDPNMYAKVVPKPQEDQRNLVNTSDDTNWNPVSSDDVLTNFSQLSISNKPTKHEENQSHPSDIHATSSTEEWSQQPGSNLNANDTRADITPDNVPVLPSDYPRSSENTHSIDSQSTVVQEHLTSNTYQSSAVKVTESLTQSGYDQWYKQTTASTTSGNEWLWTTDENVENCENIQQPSEFINLEVVAPSLQERDIYGSRDSINKETLDNDPKVSASKETNLRDFRQDVSNVEVPAVQQSVNQAPDNYEFASNDRNTFLETGELTDSHQEHEPTPPSQDDENDEVPNDIPFLREVPGQSSTTDPRRNDPTGQEQYVQTQRLSDPRRNDPSGQEQSLQVRNIPDRTDRRDVPPGQERSSSIIPLLSRSEPDTLERRNDPSGRERSLPPQQSRNDPSGEERYQSQLESSEMREVPGRGNEVEDTIQQSDGGRQILGGASSNDIMQTTDDRTNGRVVTGSQEVAHLIPSIPDQPNDSRNKREEAVGASVGEDQAISSSANRRDSYEDVDDEVSANSREDSRERRRDSSSERRRYEYDRKSSYYDRDREYDDDYYYDRRRGGDIDRSYGPRDEFDRREIPYRDDDRKHHNRDDLIRHSREEMDRRGRGKDDLDEGDARRRPDDRRRERPDDPRRRDRDARDYDSRYSRDRDYLDRDRRRDDRRRRYDEYDVRDPYRRDYYDDPYGRSSRPSSRSSYNDREREYYMRARDPYYGYNGYSGYEYGAHFGNNYYAYLENLRRTNPAAYAEWYHKYYVQHQQQQIARGVSSYPEDRASVHSGRSSCDERFFMNSSACFHTPNKALFLSHYGYPGWSRNPVHRCCMNCHSPSNRTTGDKRTLAEMSMLEDSAVASARMTPTKFSTSHAYGCFSIGSLVHVHPSYPADGERAKVDVFRLDNLLLHDPVTQELRTYSGPLIKGVTHKKTIIEYCENKIKKAAVNEAMIDRASYILLYELMIMLIQQNGNVVGVDIAALLLRNKDAYPYDTNKNKSQDGGRRESVVSQRSSTNSATGSSQDITAIPDKNESVKPRKTVEQMTDEFRNTLLYGLVQEALDSAMNDGLWGHALFLASKLDKRTHNTVMARFANSLPPSDPLQTLYQLHSGRVPAIVTCVSDPRWDDWRPHLAMIISNASANPEVNNRSIITLGDTLFARGDIHAAHFCYILAQIDFGAYGTNGVKLVLIGSNHHKPYSEFMNIEAVLLTEIYEYARNLSEPGFTLPELQTFKFDLAMKMIDYGLVEKALLYIEQIATNIVNEPLKYKISFINDVYVLGDKIKYHDPVCKDSIDDIGSLTWLNNLSEIVSKYQAGEIVEENPYSAEVNTDIRSTLQNQEIHDSKQQQQQQWNAAQPEYNEGPTSMMEVSSAGVQSHWQPLSLPTSMQDTYDQNAQYGRNNEDNQYQRSQTQDYWNQQPFYQNNYGNEGTSNWQQQPIQTPHSEQTDIDNSQQMDQWNYEPSQPSISMTPSSGKQYDPLEELDALETPKQTSKSNAESKKALEKAAEKKPSNTGGSWFGGLFSKFAPRPKNQMILPDDKNPTIVWDPVAKKWLNKDEDGENSSSALAPPPKATEIGFKPSTSEQVPPPSQMLQSSSTLPDESISTSTQKLVNANNIYKLPKVRSMRANYIDVMNPGGSKSNTTMSGIPTPATSPLVPMATSSPQLFVPAPVNDPSAPMDFLTPTPAVVAPTGNSENNQQALSRWSSTSSLSREVQSYTMRDPRLLQRNKGPMTYNPNDVKDRTMKNIPQGRYAQR